LLVFGPGMVYNGYVFKEEQAMQDVRIVEYDHSYAGAVAEMWSRSSEGWNGQDMSRTAADVISRP